MRQVSSLWTLVPWFFPWWGAIPWIAGQVIQEMKRLAESNSNIQGESK